MRKSTFLGTVLAVAVAAIVLTVGAAAFAQWGMMGGYGPGYGPGMMGNYGMMGGYGPGYGRGMMGGYGPYHGPGMMGNYGSGHGPGMMMPGWRGQNLNLSVDDVKDYLQRSLAWHGNSRLKVGDVKEKDADTIQADIVTVDNSLVRRFVINRRNGLFQPSEN
jgi:hypothetical protein